MTFHTPAAFPRFGLPLVGVSDGSGRRAGSPFMTPHASRRASAWVLALASAGSCLAALDTLVVSTALTTLRLDLGASIDQLEWTVNGYNLSFAVLLMTAAALGDRLGRRRMFAAGLALFSVASAACALAPSIGLLIAARVVQGAGAALIMTLALALVSSAFPPDRRGQALGVFFSATGLAVASGPLVGGAVTEGIAWQWIFWLNVPLGLALVPLALARIPEGFGPDAALDLRGLGLVTGGVLGLVWGLVRGNLAGWASPEVVGSLLAGAALLLAGFVAWELRTSAPMLPMRFFRARAFSAGNGAAFFAVGSLFCGVFFLSQFMQTGARRGPARRRAAAAAVDGHAVLRGAGGRRAGRPAGRAPVPRRRAAAPGRRVRVDRADRRARDGLRAARRAADRGRRRRVDVVPGGAERGRGRGPARGDRQGGGHEQHDARARRRVRDRAGGGRVRGRRRLRDRAGVHATASCPRWAWGRASRS